MWPSFLRPPILACLAIAACGGAPNPQDAQVLNPLDAPRNETPAGSADDHPNATQDDRGSSGHPQTQNTQDLEKSKALEGAHPAATADPNLERDAGSQLTALLTAHGWPQPARDAVLDRAACRLARIPLDPARTQSAPELEAARLNSGFSDAQWLPTAFRTDVTSPEDAWIRTIGRLDRRLPPTHYGICALQTPENLHALAVVFVHRGLDLTPPLPQKSLDGGLIRLKGTLQRGYFRPRLLIAFPSPEATDSPILERALPLRDRQLDAQIALEQPGFYGLEILADSQYGPIVLHNWTLQVGSDRDAHASNPALPDLTLDATDAKRTPDTQLALLINRLRRHSGRSALTPHPALTRAAQAHAAELARGGHLQHFSPDTGALATRLQGAPCTHLAENLAYAASATDALDAFIQSPAHKRNLLLSNLTHIGIGFDGDYFAVALARCGTP